MDLIIKLIDVLFPVFLIIGIGYWYGKKDPKFDTKFITTFAGNFIPTNQLIKSPPRLAVRET